VQGIREVLRWQLDDPIRARRISRTHDRRPDGSQPHGRAGSLRSTRQDQTGDHLPKGAGRQGTPGVQQVLGRGG
jgi:hypothetical protein